MPAPWLPSLVSRGGIVATIDEDMVDVDLLTWLVANTSWSGLTRARITVVVAPGVVIGAHQADAPTTPALRWGDAPAGTDLRLVVSAGAAIVGCGGYANSGWGAAGYYTGYPGGDALHVEQPIRLDNRGVIGGGGGGGALHQLVANRNWLGAGGDRVRAGSGGGAGYVRSVAPFGEPAPTLYVGGGGLNGGADGGGLGEDGVAIGSYSGGAAGSALVGVEYVTWINEGDLRGSVS